MAVAQRWWLSWCARVFGLRGEIEARVRESACGNLRCLGVGQGDPNKDPQLMAQRADVALPQSGTDQLPRRVRYGRISWLTTPTCEPHLLLGGPAYAPILWQACGASWRGPLGLVFSAVGVVRWPRSPCSTKWNAFRFQFKNELPGRDCFYAALLHSSNYWNPSLLGMHWPLAFFCQLLRCVRRLHLEAPALDRGTRVGLNAVQSLPFSQTVQVNV